MFLLLAFGHRKWFLNTNLFPIKQFLIAKFDCNMSIETKIPLQVKFELIVCNKGLLVPKKLISKLKNNNASMPTLVKTCDCGGSHDN